MELPILSLPSSGIRPALGGQSVPLWQRRGLRSKPQPTLSLAKERGVEEEALCCRARVAAEYAVVGALGQGSTSSVQHAIRHADGQHVALKTMRTEDPEMVAVARKEYELLRSLEHPNIVRPLDFIDAPGRAVLVMEFFEGRDLQETLRSQPEGRLPEHLARPLLAQLSAAVEFLHAHQVVHRDIKPQNVLISKDFKQLKLIDFNVAHCLREGQALTPTGTRLYAAPEVVLGESPADLGDIWAVGLCAYLMLSGKLPQGRDRCESHMESVSSCASREVHMQGPQWTHVSEQCKTSILRCLASQPESRALPSTTSLLESTALCSSADGRAHVASIESLLLLAPVQPCAKRLSRELLESVSNASAAREGTARSIFFSTSTASTCSGESVASVASRSSSPEP